VETAPVGGRACVARLLLIAERVTSLLRSVRSCGSCWALLALLALLVLAGCDATTSVAPGAPPCETVVTRGELTFFGIDPIDLLFVISNAPSMADEQTALARELPLLMRTLLTGELGPDRHLDHPIRDLHIAIVSADLGTGTQDAIAGCSQNGDGASFQQRSGGDECAERPAFLSYRVPRQTRHPLITPPGPEAADALVNDVSCGAALGSTGCAIAAPFEAGLRALTQAADDQPGFLRDEPSLGLSLIFVLLISDGDDCSLRDPDAFAQALQGSALEPAALCAQRADLLHDVQGYVEGLRALRRGHEELVELAAITGVPEDFALGELERDDAALRDAHYAALLADPRMQSRVREDGTLQPVCESELASATPAPRIVQTAQRLGASARVLSICAPSWTQAIAPLFEDSIAIDTVPGFCLPSKPVRGPDGLTQCHVTWTLPLPGTADESTPTRCSERASLREASPRARTPDGRAICELRQLAVTGLPDAPQLEPGEGWFVDDFSGFDLCRCETATCSTLIFAPNVPPNGVTGTFECFETKVLDAPPGSAAGDPSRCRVP